MLSLPLSLPEQATHSKKREITQTPIEKSTKRMEKPQIEAFTAPKTSISWKNLTYKVHQFSGLKRSSKLILRHLTGSCQSGTLTGLLGPSGSGKTTLLNCLSGSDSGATCLTADSHFYVSCSLKKSPISYYIQQNVTESIPQELTIGQILRYAYAFKNGAPANGAQMESFIEKSLKDLLLDVSLLNRPFSLCSGGEQKRIAIAQELMSHQAPDFLFLDEPTTGLDSAAAYEVILCLQSLARAQGITVIASIHAPNQETLALFDRLYVLAKGGVSIYSGPPSAIRTYLETEIDNFAIPSRLPPIEVLLKLACNGSDHPNVIKLATRTLANERESLSASESVLVHLPHGLPTHRKVFSLSNFATSLSRQFRVTFLTSPRSQLILPLILFTFYALLGTLFGADKAVPSACFSLVESPNSTCSSAKITIESEGLVTENVYFVMYAAFLPGFISMVSGTLTFGRKVQVFQSEHRNHWYSLGTFYWSANLVTFLDLTLTVVLMTLFSYFLSSQHAADGYTLNPLRLCVYGLFLFLQCAFYQSAGQIIGILLVNRLNIAIIACEVLFAVSCVFTGSIVKFDRTESPLLMALDNFLGIKYLSKGQYYALYGIDRCNWETEYSKVLLDYDIQPERITEYFWASVTRIALLKGTSLALMLFKFSSLPNCWKRQQNLKEEAPEIPFDAIESGMHDNVIPMLDDSVPENSLKFSALTRNKVLIGWRNLSLYASDSLLEMGATSQRQAILRHLNGQFTFGTLNALMGTSGAGKTSLLKVLNGRCKTRLSDETKMYLSSHTAITTCFITQQVEEHLMPGLSGRQMLTYASRLKNPAKGVDHEQIAGRWLQELDLLGTADTKVGNCSGGERKRLAVALELTALAMPNCVCIDEPTSGLDSNSAEIVISSLRKLVQKHPITIITSIHQPTAQVLFMFDQLYVLARGGVSIYSGPPSGIQAHLNQLSQLNQPSLPSAHAPELPAFPIETLITHFCKCHTSPIVQQLTALTSAQFLDSGSSQTEALSTQTHLVPDGVQRNRVRFSPHSVLILSLRFIAYISGYLWKEYLFNFANLLGYGASLHVLYRRDIIFASGCLNPEDDFNSTCAKSPEQLEEDFKLADSLSYNYFYTLMYLFLIIFSASISFFNEFKYFSAEHRNGWYSSGAFYLTKSLFESLPLIPLNLIYVYIIDIFDPVVPGGMYWPVFYLITLAAVGFQGMGHCFSLLGRGNFTHQTGITCGFFLLTLFLSNFCIPNSRLHYVYAFLANFSISRFLHENVLLLQYGFGRCKPHEFHSVLYLMSLTDDDYYRNVWLLVGNLVLYRLIALWLLVWRMNPVEDRRKRVSRIAKYQEKVLKNVPKTVGLESTGWSASSNGQLTLQP